MTKYTNAQRVEMSIRDYLANAAVRDTGPLAVIKTAFHGGGIVSRHTTLQGAARALVKYKSNTDCTCGCTKIVSVREIEYLPNAIDWADSSSVTNTAI